MAYLGNQALPGLHPVTNGIAGTSPRIMPYVVPAAYATRIGEGCYVQRAADDSGLVIGVGSPAAGSVYGVAAHNTKASTAQTLLVYDDPNQEYACMIDGDIANVATLQKYIGYFVTLLTNAYVSTYDQGNTKIDISTAIKTPSAARPWQIMRVANNVGEVQFGAAPSSTNSQLIVKLVTDYHVYGGMDTTAVPGA